LILDSFAARRVSFATTAEVAARLLRVKTAAIVLADSTGRLTIQSSVGLSPTLQAEWRGQRGQGLVGTVVQGGHSFVATDLLALASLSLPFGPSCPVRGLIVLPLKAGDETFGCLVLADALPRVFSPEEVEVVTLLATQTALTIENAKLYSETHQAYEELKAAQEQLIQSEKARALAEIAGGVAHDFNNILAIIVGKTQLTLKRVEDPIAREGLQTIGEAAWRAAETVRRLQSFAAIRGNDNEFTPVNLNASILDAVGVTRPRWKDEAEARDLRIEVATDLADLPQILGNPMDLREMIINLIFNALDAMPEGGRLVIRSRLAGDLVEMSVSDSGVGMSAETRRRIFDPFFTTKGPRYSGLGLAVVHGILARHYGRVEVSSQEGQGTTFIVRFPVGLEAMIPRTGPTPAKIPRPPAEASAPARILIIEDEIAIQHLLVEILRVAGHTVKAARDGQEGLALFGKEEFDVVLTDLSMPEVSGWEVARAVKKTDPRIPVILVTGWGDHLDPQSLQESGIDLVLAKPFLAEELHSALAQAMASHGRLTRQIP